jgi:hypothetical protein
MAEIFDELIQQDHELSELDDPWEIYDRESDAHYAFSSHLGQWLVGRMRRDVGAAPDQLVPAEDLLATNDRRARFMRLHNRLSVHDGTVDELVDGLQVRIVAKAQGKGHG